MHVQLRTVQPRVWHPVVCALLLCLASAILLADASDTAETPDQRIQRELAASIPDVHLKDVPLADAIDQLRKSSDANICVDWRALETLDVHWISPITCSIDNPTLADALHAVLKAAPAKIDYRVSDGVIVITTPRRAKFGRLILRLDNLNNETNQELSKALNQPAPDKLPGDLSGFFDAVANTSGAKLSIDWNTLQTVGVEHNTPVRDWPAHGVSVLARIKLALELTEADHLLVWADNGTLVIKAELPDHTSPARPVSMVSPDEDLVSKLNRAIPKVTLNNIPLPDALDFLRDIDPVNIAVDWVSLEKAGVPRTTTFNFNESDVKLTAVLDGILQTSPHKIAWRDTGGVIVLTTPERAAVLGPVTVTLDQAVIDPDLYQKLYSRLPNVQFNQVPLRETLDFLRDVAGVNIEVDWKALAKSGVDAKSPISLQQIHHASLITVLKLSLEMTGADNLTVTADANRVIISAKH